MTKFRERRESWPANAPRLSDRERGYRQREDIRMVASLVFAFGIACVLWIVGWGLGQW